MYGQRPPSGFGGAPTGHGTSYQQESLQERAGGFHGESFRQQDQSQSIDKYDTQTRQAVAGGQQSYGGPAHPLRGDPARLTQAINIRLDHDRDTMPVKNQKMFRNVASIEIGELKDALAYAEHLLAKNMEEKEALMQKDVEHTFEIKRVEDKFHDADKARKAAQSEVSQVNQKFKQMETNQQIMQDQVKNRLDTLQKEINAGQREVSNLTTQVETKESDLSQASVSSQLNNEARQVLESWLTRKDGELKRMREELDKTRRSLDTLVLQRRSEGTAQLQVESYRAENARLLALLAKTPEYSNFAEFAIDSGTGVRYMNAINPSEKAPSPNQQTRQKPCQITYTADPREGLGEENGDEWIPEEAFRVAHDFRNRCAANVSKNLMNTLLSDLNKVWRAREKKQTSRIKSEANREVQYLRREVANKKPYQQVMHEQEAKRLKAELKDAQQALRENVAVIKQEQAGPNFGLNLVDTTVRYTNEIQVQRRELLEENERLKQRIAQLELGARHM